MTKDLVLGGALLALAGAYYLAAAAIPESQLGDTVGARGLPGIYAILLAGLAVVMLSSALRRRRAQTGQSADGQPDRSLRTIGRVIGMLALGAIYILIVPIAGYLISIAALIGGTAYYQGGRLTKQVLLVAAAGAAVLWMVFVMLLRIPQPAGIWSSFR